MVAVLTRFAHTVITGTVDIAVSDMSIHCVLRYQMVGIKQNFPSFAV